MDTFSGLESTIPIAPETGRIWKTRKKSGTGDQKRNDRQYSNAKDDKKDGEIATSDGEKTEVNGQKIQNPPEEEQAVYGANRHRKNISRKIDVVI